MHSVIQINFLHEQDTRHGERGRWRHDGLTAVDERQKAPQINPAT